MIHLNDEMRELVDGAFDRGMSCLVATAAADGAPNVGYKGSMMVHRDDSLVFWERAKRGTLANLEENPKVCVLAANPPERLYLRFYGRAVILREGAERDAVMERVVPAELERDPERTGYAVVVELDRIENLRGEILQSRD